MDYWSISKIIEAICGFFEDLFDQKKTAQDPEARMIEQAFHDKKVKKKYLEKRKALQQMKNKEFLTPMKVFLLFGIAHYYYDNNPARP